ncbi:unnamed protein product [Brassica oleracea var. botrytis]|uniref:Uncharacterized protein n=3 Tax=Brassica TaxID=3705 RepID=A0A0D3D2M3_BRAOL|nr:unnamed protein product [Brassica napus]VDD35097.1 unnamed protein product [Brassica oleracea]
MSDSSSSTTGGRIRVRTPGIPIKSWCGERSKELISKTNLNPYRQYYRCRYAAQRKLENDNHIFKWVVEVFTDEIQQLDNQVRMLGFSNARRRSSSTQSNNNEWSQNNERRLSYSRSRCRCSSRNFDV